MSEEPIVLLRAVAPSVRTVSRGTAAQVRFDRSELNQILSIYGRMVAIGEWRDYAIDFLDDRAVFSIFRNASEMPLFRIEKNPYLRNRQGLYAVIDTSGQVLKRGHELGQVLRLLERKLIKSLARSG
ncbi:MAG: DUF2794 domain-containing protein [Alphaproteobacteria bacterium]|nr:DUF2794 domain-containing protein [Alphaproteobacteria bacterium]